MTCKKTQCDQGLHCFLSAPKQKGRRQALASPIAELSPAPRSVNGSYPEGLCWNCGAAVVDWPRLHERAIGDIEYTVSCLKKQASCHDWWFKPLDERAFRQAYRRGHCRMAERAAAVIRQGVAAAEPYFDGHQTKASGDVLYYAQHATGTCCRKCMALWHGIPQGRELTEEEVDYCARLLVRYVDERLPDLPSEPQRVPDMRSPWAPRGRAAAA
jgi:hypothetical protein